MFERVTGILSRYTAEQITEESALDADLGLSSLDVVAIVCEFEEAFDIEIDDRDIRTFIEVRDILKYLEERVPV